MVACRQREPARRSRHEGDRPSDRARHSSDRAEPAGREALKMTSRSFAMEAAAANRPASAPEPAEPGQLDVADLPPPPARDASKVWAVGTFCLQGMAAASSSKHRQAFPAENAVEERFV